jgi:hypothetical protein
VKIYGIPLHVWGENLFKAIGSRCGEFIDFDNNTASRGKLDVARIKMLTGFCGEIDEALKIMAMGVEYSLRVVEDKGMEQMFMHGDTSEEHEGSWTESQNIQVVVTEAEGDGSGGPTEEGDEDDDVDLPNGQYQTCALSKKVGEDVTLAEEGNCQTSPFVSAKVLEDQSGNRVQQMSEEVRILENEGTLEEPFGVKVTKGGKGVESYVVDVEGLMETCQDEGMELDSGGPGKRLDEEVEKNIRFFISEPNRSVNQTRSSSVPPDRLSGPLILGFQNQDLNLRDSISLCEVHRGVEINPACNSLPQPQKIVPSTACQRGRSRKPKSRPKPKRNPTMTAPKFLHLAEKVKEGGGGRQKKKKKGGEATKSDRGKELVVCSNVNVDNDLVGPKSMEAISMEGLNLEVVLPIIEPTPNSGSMMMEGGVEEGGGQSQDQIFSESSNLLQIQKAVGFG